MNTKLVSSIEAATRSRLAVVADDTLLLESKNRLLDTSPTQPLLPVAATAFLKPVIW